MLPPNTLPISTETPPSTQKNTITTTATNKITINLNTSIHITGIANTILITSPDQHEHQHQHQHQHQHPTRKPKVAHMTASVLASLRAAGVLGSASHVEINLDAGVRVEGSRNVVCLGGGGGASVGEGGRKRRAESEPVDGGVDGMRKR